MDAALITGASAGLGVVFAKRLAEQKQNLVLVARRKDKLEELAAELRKAHAITVVVAAADLSAPGAVAILMKKLAAHKISVTTLINNAGFTLHGLFADLDMARQQEMIDLNCAALVQLCHAVLPEMKTRGSGGILNVASTAAFQAGPRMAVYYATKAFILSFSEALHDEVKPWGIRVSCLCPGPTQTDIFTAAKISTIRLAKMAGKPEKVVADGLAALQRNQAFVVSGLHNKLLAQSTRFAPRAMTRWIAKSLQ